MKQYEIEEVLQHLESAQYIGANRAISLIHKLNQRRLALQQRVWDLEKMVVWYQDITMTGQRSEQYEEGFWDAVDFVREKQNERK